MKKKNSIEVNDRVRITDSSETYTTYSEMFLQLGFSNCESNPAWKKGEQGSVFYVGYSSHQSGGLYALVHDDGRECLISERGIELVEYETPVSRVTFESVRTRLTEIESKLDQYAQFIASQNKPQTAVEWFAEELATYDYDSGNETLEILISVGKFKQIKEQALLMEINQNCK